MMLVIVKTEAFISAFYIVILQRSESDDNEGDCDGDSCRSILAVIALLKVVTMRRMMWRAVTLLCFDFIENFEINSPLCICIFFRIPDPNAEKPEDW